MLCWTPYFTDGILAGLGGLFNPLGLFYIVASALPSTLGANAGLLSLPSMMRGWHRSEEEQVGPLQRGVDRCGCRRQLTVYLRAWPRAHVVAMTFDSLSPGRKRAAVKQMRIGALAALRRDLVFPCDSGSTSHRHHQ